MLKEFNFHIKYYVQLFYGYCFINIFFNSQFCFININIIYWVLVDIILLSNNFNTLNLYYYYYFNSYSLGVPGENSPFYK